MSFSQPTKEEWLATAEVPALESAVVFESETSKTCGHALHLVPLMDYLESCGSKKTVCPVCQASVSFVCDGAEVANSATNDDDNNDDDDDKKAKTVTVKYRNHLYKFSLQRSPNLGLPLPLACCVWVWRSLLQLMGEDTSVTAQERIAHALRMDIEGHMKILHKGKIIYPNAQQSPRAISEQLVGVCEKGGKPMVMGTRMTDQEQKIATGKWMIRLYISVIKVCLTKTISLVQGLLSPFLPQHGGGRGAPAIDRPHQD